MLAAAAFSCYSTPERFLPIALETVLVSFRTGLLAADTRDQIIESPKEGSWRIRIENGDSNSLQSQLHDFCEEKVRSLPESENLS